MSLDVAALSGGSTGPTLSSVDQFDVTEGMRGPEGEAPSAGSADQVSDLSDSSGEEESLREVRRYLPLRILVELFLTVLISRASNSFAHDELLFSYEVVLILYTSPLVHQVRSALERTLRGEG